MREPCPSCGLSSLLVDDGQNLGLLICEKCKQVADILDRTPIRLWPGNDGTPREELDRSLHDWMRQCHRDLLTTGPGAGDYDSAGLETQDQWVERAEAERREYARLIKTGEIPTRPNEDERA